MRGLGYLTGAGFRVVLSHTHAHETVQGREEVLQQLLGPANWRCPPWIDSPFHCNYGFNITGGRWLGIFGGGSWCVRVSAELR